LINNVPLPELQVFLSNGKKNGFFAGFSEGELRWIASELRTALKLPMANPNVAAASSGGSSLAPTEPELS
jgi:hypothetical protein